METDCDGLPRNDKDKEKRVSGPHHPLENKTDIPYPESYKINFPDETRLLEIAENFQRQYSHLFPDRRPLLLCPTNECGVKKFVSTTLRPTPTPHPELFTWEGCASFVADFLALEPLAPPCDLPGYLFSPTTVLHSRRATCFEFATVLCSLLLGADFDAYCVSGYAVKEMCLLDQRLQDCPVLDTPMENVTPDEETQPETKYTVKPLGELKSRFIEQQEKKEKQEAEAASLQNQNAQEETTQAPADPLQGLRVHCWVLVLSGSRSVQKDFFIDPLSGISYSLAAKSFLGIESIWNNFNYYVNMQDSQNGCADLVYDLEDLNMWEPVLFGARSRKQLILDAMDKKEEVDDVELAEKPRVFEMPQSWVSSITISKEDLDMRWPGGQKVICYRLAELRKFALNIRPDGLVTQLVTYKDPDCTEVHTMKEWYQHRCDHLEQREVNKVDNCTTERFRCGRNFHILFHRYQSLTTDGVHEMEFSNAHADNVVRRLVSPGEMTEMFDGRADLLYYRHAIFDRHIQFLDTDLDIRLLKVVERFHRNRSKPANEDVAERVFLLADRRIEVTFHLQNHRSIPSRRSFIKPQESTEIKKAEDFTPDMVHSFQVDPSETSLGTLSLYNMLVALMKDEEMVTHQIKESMKEVRDIVSCRQQEERDIRLVFSPWTSVGTAMARSQRQEMERLAVEEQRWLQERDILAPFLFRLNISEPLSTMDARQLYKECLSEIQQRQVEDANLIQERYAKETQELQKWYQKSQLSMMQQQEEEYRSFCAEKTAQINVAQRRLRMHRKAAPQKYRALDQKLRQDPRLASHLLSSP